MNRMCWIIAVMVMLFSVDGFAELVEKDFTYPDGVVCCGGITLDIDTGLEWLAHV